MLYLSTLRSVQVTAERLQRLLPLVIIPRFARAKRDAERAEIGGAAGLFSAGVDVRPRLNLELDETGGRNCQSDLSFQESTRNSTRPEPNVLLCTLRYRLLDQDVADLQPATGPEHARHLAQGSVLVRHQIENAIGDDHVGPAILHRQRFGETVAELHIIDAHFRCARTSF
jgi:hypothetical protein